MDPAPSSPEALLESNTEKSEESKSAKSYNVELIEILMKWRSILLDGMFRTLQSLHNTCSVNVLRIVRCA